MEVLGPYKATVLSITPKKYEDGSAVNITTNYTLTDDEVNFILGSGTSLISLIISSTRTRPITIKHVGTQDMTITMQSGQVDQNSNVVLRGGKKNSVTLNFQGGNAWIT